MKKLKKLGLLSLPLLVALAIIPPVYMSGEVVLAEASTVKEISTLADLNDVKNDLTGNFILKGNIEIKNDWIPIGTQENPFTGTFDGNGFTINGIKIDTSTRYQGLFGYTSGAEIKNLKISYKTTENNGVSEKGAVIDYNFDNQAEYYAGTIVGYANNSTKISNCEVDNGSEVEETFTCKVTLGGLVGVLKGGSVIKNCANYRNIKLKENFTSTGYTTTVGGAVGEVESSELINVVNFGGITVARDDEIVNDNYIGGLVGDASGERSCIVNCVSGGDVKIDSKLEEKDTNCLGSVVGFISSTRTPISGKIASVAYSQDIEKYGKSEPYVYSNNSTYDYVSRLPSEKLRLSELYFLGKGEKYTYSFSNGVEQEFDWSSGIGNGWSNDVWSIVVVENVGEIRLQKFQSYTIAWAEGISSSTSNVLKKETGDTVREVGKFGEIATLSISIDSADVGYYDIIDVIYNNKSCKGQYQILLTQSEELDDDKDMGYYFNSETNKYILKVRLSSKTAGISGAEGSYSFELQAKEFSGAVYVNTDEIKGAIVKFSEGSNKERVFIKQTSKMTASANAGSRYTFQGWKLYLFTDDPDDLIWTTEGEEKTLNYGYLIAYNKKWKYEGTVYEIQGSEAIKTGTIEKNLPIKFGETTPGYEIRTIEGVSGTPLSLTENFLFEAVYEEDPYYISFAEDVNAREGIDSLKVNNQLMERNEQGNFSLIDIGKNETVIIEVTMDVNYQLDADRFVSSVKKAAINNKDIVKVSQKEVGNKKLYIFTFSTGQLSEMNAKDYRKFTFDLIGKTTKNENNNSSLGWIIGGSIGGGLLLAGLIVLIVFLVKRRSTTRKINNDYKRYYN